MLHSTLITCTLEAFEKHSCPLVQNWKSSIHVQGINNLKALKNKTNKMQVRGHSFWFDCQICNDFLRLKECGTLAGKIWNIHCSWLISVTVKTYVNVAMQWRNTTYINNIPRWIIILTQYTDVLLLNLMN